MSAQELITEHLDLWTSATTHAANGRGKNGKVELIGIQKLRELILQLAIQGKLVPQNPDAESASSLLQRIKEEKEYLLQRGKIKKTRSLSPMGEDEIPADLPQSWGYARAGDFLHIEMGQSPASKFYNQTGNGLPFFQGKADFGDLYPEPRYWCTKPSKYAESGDILLSVRAPVGPTNICNISACIGRGLCALRPLSGVPSLMVFYMFRAIRSDLERKATGTTFSAVSRKDIESLVLRIPPLEEQHRIVQKVDELMALCDRLERQTTDQLEAHETLVDTLLNTLTQSENATDLADNWARLAAHFDILFTTEQSIEKLKQTIQQLAVTGRLVKPDAEDEPSLDLLERTKAEKDRLINQGVIKAQVKPKLSTGHKDSNQLPDSWILANLDDLAHVQGGIQKQPKRHPVANKYPYLRVADVQRGAILECTNLPEFELFADELKQYGLKKGDILVVEGNGSAEEIGRCAVWDGQVPNCVYQNHLMRIRPIVNDTSDFLALYLNSPAGIAEMKRLAVTSSGLYNLSVGKIRSIAVPLPPLCEQAGIIQKVDELMALCNQLKERLNQISETRCKLAESVVEGALQA